MCRILDLLSVKLRIFTNSRDRSSFSQKPQKKWPRPPKTPLQSIFSEIGQKPFKFFSKNWKNGQKWPIWVEVNFLHAGFSARKPLFWIGTFFRKIRHGTLVFLVRGGMCRPFSEKKVKIYLRNDNFFRKLGIFWVSNSRKQNWKNAIFAQGCSICKF